MGGIVAVSYGTISECSSKGRFYSVIEANDAVPNTNAGNSFGTIARINYGTIEECNNQCEITNYTINDSCYWGYDGGAGGIVGVTEGKVGCPRSGMEPGHIVFLLKPLPGCAGIQLNDADFSDVMVHAATHGVINHGPPLLVLVLFTSDIVISIYHKSELQ